MRVGATLCPPPAACPTPTIQRPPLPRARPRNPVPVPPPEPRPEPPVLAPQAAIILPPARPLPRRAARRLLRLLRPLALPLLHRLDWRIRGAVERTDAIQRIAAATATLAAQLHAERDATAEARAADAHSRTRLDLIEQHLRGLTAQLQLLDAARQHDRAALLAAIAEARTPPETLAALALRLDAAHLQQSDASRASRTAAREIQDRLAPLQGGLKSLHDGLAPLQGGLSSLQDRLVSLHLKTDDSGAHLIALQDAAASLLANVNAAAAQLARRYLIPAGPDVAIRTDDGYLVVPLEDEAQIAAMVETAGQLEPGTLAVACALATPGGLAIDAGAHVGTFTVPLARRLGDTGLLIAVEPTPRTAAILRRTLALNGLESRVQLHQCAAGAAPGQARFHLAALGSHNSLMPLGAETQSETEVAVCPLDSLAPPGRPACLIKLDVEGAELDALHGAARLLADSPRAGLIAEFGPSHLARAGIAIPDWLAAFRAHGLAPWEIDEAAGTVSPLRTDLATLHSINLLWLRDPPETYPGLRLA